MLMNAHVVQEFTLGKDCKLLLQNIELYYNDVCNFVPFFALFLGWFGYILRMCSFWTHWC